MAEEYKNESWLREKYWDEGKSQAEIAHNLEVSAKTVCRWMKKHNIETRSKSEIVSEGDIEKLKNEEWLREQYIHQGKSQAEIANEIDVSRSTVGAWMDKHGIEARSNSESQSEGDVGKLKDEEWLREQYINQERLMVDIAHELEVHSSTVCRWMDEHGIEARSNSEIKSGEMLKNSEMKNG